jgi:hypothetical protein
VGVPKPSAPEPSSIGQMVFWDVHDPKKTISLEHEFYRKLIIEVADPSATVAMLQAPLRR